MEQNGDTTTIRYPALSELEVSSIDRYKNPLDAFNAPTSSVDIKFEARQSLLSGYFTRIGLTEIQLQWRTPNFNPYNNFFSWISEKANGSLVQYDIPDIGIAFFDASGIITEVVSRMNSEEAANTYSASPSGDDGYEIIKNAAAGQGTRFRFALPSEAPLDKQDVLTKFYLTLGAAEFVGVSPFTLGVRKEAIPPYPDLAYTRYIDIVSNTLAKYSRVKDAMTRQDLGQTNVIARVFLTPFGQKERTPYFTPFTLCVDYTTPKYIRWNAGEYVNNFDVSIYDQYGELLWCDPENWPIYMTEYQMNIQASET